MFFQLIKKWQFLRPKRAAKNSSDSQTCKTKQNNIIYAQTEQTCKKDVYDHVMSVIMWPLQLTSIKLIQTVMWHYTVSNTKWHYTSNPSQSSSLPLKNLVTDVCVWKVTGIGCRLCSLNQGKAWLTITTHSDYFQQKYCRTFGSDRHQRFQNESWRTSLSSSFLPSFFHKKGVFKGI